MKKNRIIAILLCLTLVCGLFYFNQQSKTETRAAKKLPALKVSGRYLTTKSEKKVQLRGVSTHGIAWYPQYINKKSFKTLRDDWHANVVRLAMYTHEYGGYCAGGDKKALRRQVEKGVDIATELGMYVIIDWHILSDNNPRSHQKASKNFFKHMAKKYKNHTNVLYEICNEPHDCSWPNDIKPYAKALTKVIRKYDKDAVIIVGTNTWSQDVDVAAADRLPDKNTMYTYHFYAASHKGDARKRVKNAIKAGLPIFVTECSICEYSGSGTVNKTQGAKWLKLLNKYKVSYVAWNLSNKNEASAVIKPSCNKTYGWKTSQLSATGKWFRKVMRKK